VLLCSLARLRLGLAAGVALLSLAALTAQTTKSKLPKRSSRVVVGKLVSPQGSLLSRAAGKKWRLPRKGTPVYSGDMEIGLPLADILSKNGAVGLRLRANLEGRSPLPSLESAVVLHPAKDVDLDLTLDRGQIVLANKRARGPSKVRVRFRDQRWELTLEDADTLVGLDLCGLWLPGSRFNPKAKVQPTPPTTLMLMVLKGHAHLQTPLGEYGLKAPPGPATMQWDSVGGQDTRPHDLEKMPDWVKKLVLTAEQKDRIARFVKLVQAKTLPGALRTMLASDKPRDRRAAVYIAAALDELLVVGDALVAGKHPDLWDDAVIAIRHWMGRGAGQDLLLYKSLRKNRELSRAEAATVVQMLHTFDDAELEHPELYEALIEYLKSDQLAIRGLANWHLHRLVPAGRGIAFDPAGPEADRLRAYKEWKKLIPTGKMPPAVTPGAGLKPKS
jgi:hypothetical protein